MNQILIILKIHAALYFDGISSCNTCPPAVFALVVAGGNFLMHRAGLKSISPENGTYDHIKNRDDLNYFGIKLSYNNQEPVTLGMMIRLG